MYDAFRSLDLWISVVLVSFDHGQLCIVYRVGLPRLQRFNWRRIVRVEIIGEVDIFVHVNSSLMRCNTGKLFQILVSSNDSSMNL